MGDQSHTFRYEQGGCAALGGIMPHLVRNQPDGTMDLGELAAAIRPDDIHAPAIRLICLENTHNRCGGVPLTVEYTHQVAELAHSHGLRLHIDGARLFNASVALGVDAKELVADADSVTFCLSKGLARRSARSSAARREFIDAGSRRNRKVLGGGMRQVGVLAAAGIVALDEMVDRLADDHANAEALAAGLAGPARHRGRAGVGAHRHRLLQDPAPRHGRCRASASGWKQYGVRMADMDPRRVRAVTNYHVTRRRHRHRRCERCARSSRKSAVPTAMTRKHEGSRVECPFVSL